MTENRPPKRTGKVSQYSQEMHWMMWEHLREARQQSQDLRAVRNYVGAMLIMHLILLGLTVLIG
jgi:hypothetical protein